MATRQHSCAKVLQRRNIINDPVLDLPTSSFMFPLPLFLLMRFPQVEASPEEERNDGER